mmetsp:Transcript_31116/g.64696  ORF Transcript_31116/g.64696 Transcript_31116/m.64696 type:complete len:316 (-) Transcript_31116:1201-2148(-)
MNIKTSAIFLGHGGGPLPLLKDASHRSMIETLSKTGRIWKSFHDPKVKSIIFVSAHYVASSELSSNGLYSNGSGNSGTILVQCEARPKLLFDYYGFPPESYEYEMANPGSVELAERIVSLINNDVSDKEGNDINPIKSLIHAKLDKRHRGFDHGVFVPMLAINAPQNIPIVTVSLANDHDTSAHIALGQALAPLRNDGVLIIGSGLGFHNLGAFFGGGGVSAEEVKKRAQEFDDGLEILLRETSEKKTSMVEKWRSTLPWSQFCHPTAEHLMPLFVVLGTVLGTGSGYDTEVCLEYMERISFDMMGIPTSHYIFD